MLTCRSLRGAVIFSTLMLVFSLVTGVSAVSDWLPRVFVGYLGFLMLLGAAGILGVTFLLSLIPANARRLSGCEH